MLKQRKTPLAHYLEYYGLIFLGWIIRALSRRACWHLNGLLAFIAFDILRIRRKEAVINLKESLGYSSDLKSMARQAFRHIGFTFIELLRYPLMKGRILTFFETESIERLERIVPKDRPGIFVSAHFGSWEMLGALLPELGYRPAVLVKPQSNRLVNSLIEKYRKLVGIRVLSTDQSLKELILSIRRSDFLGIISDQDAGSQGVFVDFFGRKASTPTGAAMLALRYSVPLYVIMGLRISPEKYRFLIKEVQIEEGWRESEVTQAYTQIIEDIIRKNPEQYFWMHRRWKTRLPDECSPDKKVKNQSRELCRDYDAAQHSSASETVYSGDEETAFRKAP